MINSNTTQPNKLQLIFQGATTAAFCAVILYASLVMRYRFSAESLLSQFIFTLVFVSNLLASLGLLKALSQHHEKGDGTKQMMFSTVLFLVSAPFVDKALYWSPLTILLAALTVLPAGLVSVVLLVEHLQKKNANKQ